MPKTEKSDVKGLMRVTVQIGDRRFDEDLGTQLFIAPDMAGIDKALETGAARQAEWAMLVAFARTEHDEIKANIGIVETKIKDREAVALITVVSNPTVKFTVDAVKAMVQIDPQRLELVAAKQELESALREAADRLRVLEVGKESMKDRKDYVIERARDMRQEMQAKMNVPVPAGGDLSSYRPGGR